IVDHDVHSSPRAQGGLDDRLSALRARHTIGVGDGFTALPAYLLCDGVRRVGVRACSGHRTAGVVDDDARTTRCQQQRVLLAQPTTGTGDHRNLLVEPHVVETHYVTGSSFMP